MIDFATQARIESFPSDVIPMNGRRQLCVHGGGMAVPAEPLRPTSVSLHPRLPFGDLTVSLPHAHPSGRVKGLADVPIGAAPDLGSTVV